MSATFDDVISKLEVATRNGKRKLASLEKQMLDKQITTLELEVAEQRGFLRGLKRAHQVVSGEQLDNELPLEMG